MSGVFNNIKNEIQMSWMIAGGVALSVIFLGPTAQNYMTAIPVIGGFTPLTHLGIFAGVSAMAADYAVRIIHSA